MPTNHHERRPSVALTGYRWRRATPGIQLIESDKGLIFEAILAIERGVLGIGLVLAGVGQASGGLGEG
jgi:hypothetical protein